MSLNDQSYKVSNSKILNFHKLSGSGSSSNAKDEIENKTIRHHPQTFEVNFFAIFLKATREQA